ncbi:deleted in malignant brain tumors 1 protein-like isoform X2 [Rhinatrema bivittatum]|uniref:deleted in malignant brain tumors 1 protein-like isoform X2 n=1 Tax=Rhinatrema bivittatum TaxID=194408 RepID=UPI00112B5F94|nr:deleted in malignant brain tumors 1 protein-like isoform X2 [Rhinatrema bivittatum]
MAWKCLYPVLLLSHAGAYGSGISQVQLVGGSSRCQGRLEVTYDGRRGSVCPDRWNIRQAAVVCAQLGCGPAQESLTDPQFGAGSGPHCLSEIDCFGPEKELSACDRGALSWTPTDHQWDAGVICSPSGISNVRLVGGQSNCMGLLEVNIGSNWGTVCDKDWGSQDAAVVCKQLKCGSALEELEGGPISPSHSGSWLLTSAFCAGSESSLSECGASTWSGGTDCQRNGDANVSCAPDSGGLELRLVNGSSSCDGRVEVRYKGTWGSASQFHWDMEEAQVVCKQLRCGEARRVMRNDYFGPGPGLMWLKATYCSGSETQLSDCGLLISGQALSPNSGDNVGVICGGPLSQWSVVFVLLRGIFYFCTFAAIHLGYFITGRSSSKKHERELRRRFRRSEGAVEEEVEV